MTAPTDMNFYNELSKVSNYLLKDYDFIIDTNNVLKHKAKAQLSKIVTVPYQAFYSQVKEVDIAWKHFKFEKQPQVCGKINILPFKTVFGDWEGIVWFNNQSNSELQQFRVFDFFSNEACVGFYDNDDQSKELFYLYFGEKPLSLSLDVEGYCKMLQQSYGFFYWQLAIVEIKTNKSSPESRDFKHYMPQLFQDFNYDKFVELYRQLKINP
jgi:hypothetical protein